MKFICSLFVVEDIYRTRQLYEGILHQKVIADFGDANVAFEGGLAFYKRSLYQSLIGDKPILNSPNNCELYFEEDHLSDIQNELLSGGFEFLHTIKEEPWRQQVFRFYDCDHHIVVIAEIMQNVTLRLLQEHKSIQEIAAVTGLPVAEITQHIQDAEAKGLLGQPFQVDLHTGG